jgi:hypothetical protein
LPISRRRILKAFFPLDARPNQPQQAMKDFHATASIHCRVAMQVMSFIIKKTAVPVCSLGAMKDNSNMKMFIPKFVSSYAPWFQVIRKH